MAAKTGILSSWLKAASAETKQIGWDLALFLALLSAFFFWSVSRGRKKLVVAVIAIYILNTIFPLIPLSFLTDGRSSVEIFAVSAVAFILLLAVLFIFLSRAFKGLSDSKNAWWQALILSVLATVFLFVSILNLAPDQILKNNSLGLSQAVLNLFSDSTISRFWIILPVLGIIFF